MKTITAASIGLLALAAAGNADATMTNFGSSLTGDANLVQAHQADTAFWHAGAAGQMSTATPVAGQIRTVRVKGRANSRPVEGRPGGETMWHLQSLRRNAAGSFTIIQSSQAFFMPTTGDVNQITSFSPKDFCVNQGDILAFNTVGGWDGIVDQTGPYPMGTPLQIFSRSAVATLLSFEGADKTNNGDTMVPKPDSQTELLMQATVGQDVDAVSHCPGGRIASDGSIVPEGGFKPGGGGGAAGGGSKAAPQKLTIPKQRVTVTKKGSVSVSVFCQPGASSCSGKVSLMSKGRKPTSYGAKTVTIKPKSNGKARINLNKAGKKAFKQKKSKLPVVVTAVMNPGGADRTSTFGVTLRRRGA